MARFGIERQHFRGDESGIEAIGDQVGAGRGDYKPSGVERLATFKSDGGQPCCASHRHRGPHELPGRVFSMFVAGVYKRIHVFMQLVVRFLVNVHHVPGFVIREADILANFRFESHVIHGVLNGV